MCSIPAADNGVKANIAVLENSILEPRHWTKGGHKLQVAVNDRATDSTNDEGGETESPVSIGRVSEW